MRARRLPDDDKSCGWWETAPSPSPPRRLESKEFADFVVVGAGFTGMAIARRLAGLQPDKRVALIEAQRVGYGSAGRNSGFVGDISHRNPKLSMEDTDRLKRLCRHGLDQLKELVDTHSIECDWTECGRIHAAVSDKGMRNFDHLCGFLKKVEEPYEVLESRTLEAAIGTGYYRAGVHVKRTILLQPVILARGVADSLPDNVTLFEESPVLRIGKHGGWTVTTDAGEVRAPRLFLAVNGFASALGVLRRRIFPLLTFASLTRVLTKEERSLVGEWPQWGIVPEDRSGTSLRRTAQNRLLIRNDVAYAPKLKCSPGRMRKVKALHRRSMVNRWPGLADCELEYTWGGVLGMTMNQGHFFGRLAERLYASLGFNGTGLAMGTASGSLLADFSLAADSTLLEDIQKVASPSWLPPEPFLGIGVRFTTAYMKSRAGPEL